MGTIAVRTGINTPATATTPSANSRSAAGLPILESDFQRFASGMTGRHRRSAWPTVGYSGSILFVAVDNTELRPVTVVRCF